MLWDVGRTWMRPEFKEVTGYFLELQTERCKKKGKKKLLVVLVTVASVAGEPGAWALWLHCGLQQGSGRGSG